MILPFLAWPKEEASAQKESGHGSKTGAERTK